MKSAMQRDELTETPRGNGDEGSERTFGLGAVVLLLLAASITVTATSGPATPLPNAALSSQVLFHVERAGALFLILLGALALMRAAFSGQLPAEVSPQA
jgi:formate hydrogenlyase subunit 3/multisubunit Na+/H+ antiporter MnhD subunit